MESADPSPAARATNMRMVVIVFRSALEEDVVAVLRQVGIDAFTGLPEVFGTGETGGAFHSFEWRNSNAMIMTAVDDETAIRLLRAIEQFRDGAATRRPGGRIALHAFVLPCTQAL
jgi:nitrogen regulatory protein PII